MRFNNNNDLVNYVDNSALKTTHLDPQNYAPSFWHDFHNTEQASGIIVSVSAQGSLTLNDVRINADKATTPNVAPNMDNTTNPTWNSPKLWDYWCVR